jgi:hypothetical protein
MTVLMKMLNDGVDEEACWVWPRPSNEISLAHVPIPSRKALKPSSHALCIHPTLERQQYTRARLGLHPAASAVEPSRSSNPHNCAGLHNLVLVMRSALGTSSFHETSTNKAPTQAQQRLVAGTIYGVVVAVDRKLGVPVVVFSGAGYHACPRRYAFLCTPSLSLSHYSLHMHTLPLAHRFLQRLLALDH